jgi:hypothetical protein
VERLAIEPSGGCNNSGNSHAVWALSGEDTDSDWEGNVPIPGGQVRLRAALDFRGSFDPLASTLMAAIGGPEGNVATFLVGPFVTQGEPSRSFFSFDHAGPPEIEARLDLQQSMFRLEVEGVGPLHTIHSGDIVLSLVMSHGAAVEAVHVNANGGELAFAADPEPDCLPPGSPVDLAFDGETALVWGSPGDGDLAFFTVYGSASAVLDGTAFVIGETTRAHQDLGATDYLYYHATSTDLAGNESSPATVARGSTGATAMQGNVATILYGMHPNPVRVPAFITFGLANAGHVKLEIFDIAGRRIRRLMEETRDSGSHSVTWDGEDDSGNRKAAGIYFYRIEVGDFRQTRKLTLMN